jgi:cold shock CspA family protein
MFGRVRDFDRGFGFIVYEGDFGGLLNIFVHHKNIVGMDGYRHLPVGATVQFEIVVDHHGRHAENVRVIEGAETTPGEI